MVVLVKMSQAGATTNYSETFVKTRQKYYKVLILINNSVYENVLNEVNTYER